MRPTTLLASTLALAASISGSLALVVPRDVFVPRIISPNSSTVWVVGSRVNVTWDTSNAPEVITKGSAVALNKGDIPIDKFNHPGGFLAEGFDLLDGFVEITVPEVESGDDYSITLFGDSGNRSDMFTITE
ncbi:hypothetical protein VKT23_004676 [Stygiomarasmius scandens]|uniref:Ser-Thr-rich glycosyl-phosphatidyl-inositol-anchored membrane family-domain-containing protein n=1 Tax=Marasmiellus scandens TaxID=2682957 RepID=A0ABR1JUT2_9AGAR